MRDRITEITLTIYGVELGSYYVFKNSLDWFPKLNTIVMDYDDDLSCMIWKDFEAIFGKDRIQTLCMQPSNWDDFSYDTPIIPQPDVETLILKHYTDLNNSFMLYVMKRFPHLKKLGVVYPRNFEEMYDELQALLERSELILFLKYLYSIQTVTDIYIAMNVKEVLKHLLSLFKSLNQNQLQDTTLSLDFQGENLQDDAAVIKFARKDSRNKICIIMDRGMDHQSESLLLLEKVGFFIHRLHLDWIRDNLGTILNTVAAHCPRLFSLIISNGGDESLEYSPINETITQTITVKRLEFRDYQMTAHLFALIPKQFPCLKDLVLCGFNKWEIPGSYFPMMTPFMSIDYFRLRLDRCSDDFMFSFKKVFIKLETVHQKTRYYDLNCESPEYVVENHLYSHINSTEADYQKSIQDDNYMTLFIKCKSVTKFVPTFSFSHKH